MQRHLNCHDTGKRVDNKLKQIETNHYPPLMFVHHVGLYENSNTPLTVSI